MEQIAASAGSGKTYTLTRRFLAHLAKALPDGGPSLCLLESGTPGGNNVPRHSLAGILAATFTNKAATEMQARVVKELKQQALAPGTGDADFPLTPEEARHWVEVILRRFDAVNIRTIDSLLTLLVRLNALSLSLPPDFTPLFSLDEALLPLYDALLDQASANAETERLFRRACRSLLFHHRAKGVAAGHLLRDRLHEIIRLHLDGKQLPSETDGQKAAALLADIHTDMCAAGLALHRFMEEERLEMLENARIFLGRCLDCPPLTIPDFPETFAHKPNLDDWLKKSSKGNASQDAHQALVDLLNAYQRLKGHGPALVTTVEFMPLVALARPLISGLDIIQREEGLVPASRLPALAFASLESGNGVSDAFCRLGDTLVHLLFDEFQDTSTDQWKAILPLVIESLSRGGSLTYVGDVKQAIYGWRGGNASLFDAVADDTDLAVMLEHGPKRTTLPCNWRSAPVIVETNNHIFGRLAEPTFARRVLEAMLPAKTEPDLFAETARTLASAFTHCVQDVPGKNAHKNGLVRLTKVDAQSTGELLEAAQKILHALLVNDLLQRRSPGEIAILVRRNSEAANVAQWLAEWKIPVVTEHSFCLGSHPLIVRIVDTLFFLEYPLDDVAFFSAISGPELFPPLGGPDRSTLYNWLAETRKDPGAPPLYVAFRRSFPKAWQNLLAPFHDQAGLLSAYDTVCELVRHCRLFERYPEHAPFLRRFEEVAHAAENKGFSSLSAFLDHWTESGGNERVPMPENMNAVRILSMHKAKGLEFPVVIVPFHHQTDPPMRPLAVERVHGIPLITYRQSHTAEAIRGVVEQINLLYVTWTRPTEELHAFITQSTHSASRSALGKALAALLEDVPFANGVFTQGVAPQKLAAPMVDAAQPEKITGQPMDEGSALMTEADFPFSLLDATCNTPPPRLMAWLPRLKIYRNQMDGKGFSERQRGLLAHACLEALRLTGELQTDIVKAVNQGLRAFPVPMPDPESVRRDMAAMLEWYASIPEARIWMQYGSPEQPLMDKNGSIQRIDLLVDAPGSPLLAVEYKTGQPSPDHAVQVVQYLSLLVPAIARREPGRAVQGVVVYLDFKKIVPITAPDAAHAGPGKGHVPERKR